MPSSPQIARVSPGLINPTDNNARFVPSQTNNSIWVDYVINNRYEQDHQIYMIPVTAPVTTSNGKRVSFVQLANPTVIWICDWTAARWNLKPTIPDPNTIDADWILLNEHIEPGTITVGGDGVTPLYRISGTYFFGCTNPPAHANQVANFSRPPWLENGFNRLVPDSLWEKNLCDGFHQTEQRP